MEFIEAENGQREENMLMRRSHRKRNVRKDDECEWHLAERRLANNQDLNPISVMVADKHVPSRAWASLPTSYLYLGTSQEDSSSKWSCTAVFAKKDIPLRTKFGPFEGDVKMLDDLRTYKANAVKENRPLLFLGSSSVLDVSNKSMFFAFKFSF